MGPCLLRIRGLRRELQVGPHLNRRLRVIAAAGQNQSEQLPRERISRRRIQPHRFVRALFGRLRLHQIVVGYGVEEEGERVTRGIEFYRGAGSRSQAPPVLGLDFERANLQIRLDRRWVCLYGFTVVDLRLLESFWASASLPNSTQAAA